ncbi:MAG TPA: glycoside hydrolase family 9 protein [Bryobacteraceae bacterium]|nr:glycoside hydrolase family 9 protein [Bryobacteraceae bacterium]
MRIVSALFLLALPVVAANPTFEIKVDQAGYLPRAPKLAMVAAPNAGAQFTICRSKDGSVAFRGQLSPGQRDADSGDAIQTADFSKFADTGRFYVDVPGVGRSWDFNIGADAYARAYYLALRSFYGQRCGTAVDLGPEFPGFKHGPCHLHAEFHPSSGKTGPANITGGWHDAGDYGRYIVNSGITTGTLLWTWELFGPRVAKIGLNIPESGKGLPDMLAEIRWNLDWMLEMQDTDGGLWQKEMTEQFGGFVRPEQDGLHKIIGTGKPPYKSSCATADFAAVMAIASRVYAKHDAAFSRHTLDAAKKAWTWVEQNPNVIYRNPAGVNTGEYGDNDCGDEHLWAAAELWRTTKDNAYGNYFTSHYSGYTNTLRAVRPQDWQYVAPLAMWTWVLGGAKDDAAKDIRERTQKAADQIVARSAKNGYRTSLAPSDYIWGSNGLDANYGMELVVTNLLHPDERYTNAALDNLHYLLGRNTFSLSWVTAVGEHAFLHPHHRPSGADGIDAPWPGLLSGGPNHDREDAVLKALPDLPPAKIYADDQNSYASNENAINWNAALVFLLASALPAK